MTLPRRYRTDATSGGISGVLSDEHRVVARPCAARAGGWLAFTLLTFGFITTFGSVAMASGVMSLAVDKG